MKFISNTTNQTIFVGGKMIHPGEGREFADDEVPPEHRDPVDVVVDAGPSLDTVVQELQLKPLRELVPLLAGLTYEALERLESVEAHTELPRKTLLEALAAERVKRADGNLDSLEGLKDSDPDADAAKAVQAAQEAAQTALQAAIAALAANTDHAQATALQTAVLDAEEAARAAGVAVTTVELQ